MFTDPDRFDVTRPPLDDVAIELRRESGNIPKKRAAAQPNS
jgi:hypothetical protein